MKSSIPVPTLNRLPLYYREFRRAVDNGFETMNSKELGEKLSMPDTQIRKDLCYLDESGRQRVGYDTRTMAACLEEYLGLMDEKQAVLVGVGNLARALITYPEFRRYGLQFRALFDNDPGKIDSEVDGLKVLSVDELEDLIRRLSVRIGIITTPVEAAQKVADVMVAGGVIAIWNFAPLQLRVPGSVYVINENLAIDFAKLSHHVQKVKVLDVK